MSAPKTLPTPEEAIVEVLQFRLRRAVEEVRMAKQHLATCDAVANELDAAYRESLERAEIARKKLAEQTTEVS